jgi:hypothetical protein
MARRSLLPKILHAPHDQSELTMRIPDRRMIKRLFGDPPLAPGENEEDYWDLFDFLCEEARPLSGLDIPFLLNWTSLEWEDRRLRHQKEALIRLELPLQIERSLRRGGYKDDEITRIMRRWQRRKESASSDLERRLRAIGTSFGDLRSQVLFEEIETFRALDDLSAQNHRQRLQLRQELDRSKRHAFDEILLRLELKSRMLPQDRMESPFPEQAEVKEQKDVSSLTDETKALNETI